MRSRIALEKIPIEQRFSADDRELVTLAEILVRSGIAAVEDWERSGRDAAKYLSLTLERWVREHGGDRLTDDLTSISVSATDSLTTQMSVGQKGRSTLDGRSGQCRLCASWRGHRVARKDPSSLAIHLLRVLCAVAQPMGAGVRVSDAEERVEMLREWYEGEEYAEQYEMPDVGGCTPACFQESPLSLQALKQLGKGIRNREVRGMIGGLLELCWVSNQAKRPEFTDEMEEQLMDSNPPLPCLLAAFSSGDAVVACFDDEAQTAMEVSPQPNLIISVKLTDPASVKLDFRTLGVFCETLAAACRLIDRMPGNDDGVITREGQSRTSTCGLETTGLLPSSRQYCSIRWTPSFCDCARGQASVE